MSDNLDARDQIGAMDPEKMLALDTDRIWATGAQVFVNPDFSILIFREQNHLNYDDGTGREPRLVIKNLASVVMPTNVLREVSRILVEQIEQLDANADVNTAL